MYSAIADPEFQARAKESGASAYFVKGSMQFADLLALIDRLVMV